MAANKSSQFSNKKKDINRLYVQKKNRSKKGKIPLNSSLDSAFANERLLGTSVEQNTFLSYMSMSQTQQISAEETVENDPSRPLDQGLQETEQLDFGTERGG